MSIRFSIIIPVYNTAEYVEKCVRSVLSQSYENYEIIIVNDGSVDASLAICNNLAAENQCIKIINQYNQGLSNARNTGLKYAEGEYVIFLDSDDSWLHQEVLSEFDKRISLNSADVLSFNYCKSTVCGEISAPCLPAASMPSNLTEKLSLEYMQNEGIWIACAWNKVVKRTVFDGGECRFREGITAEDIDWCVRTALRADSFDYVNTVAVAYLQRPESISKKMTLKKVQCLYDNIIESITLLSLADNEKSHILEPYISYQVGTLLYTTAQLKNKAERRKMISQIRHLVPWLDKSRSKKVRMLKVAVRFTGLQNAIKLLRIHDFISTFRK